MELLAGTNHIQEYCYLSTRLHQVNVTKDDEFQRRYRAFWAMNVARLSEGFIQSYFEYLEQNKQAQDLNLRAVTTHLYEIPTGKDRRQSLQFSFASKLVHMVLPNRPVYDRLVESFYFLPTGAATGLDRLETLMVSYDFLIREYQRVMDSNLLNIAIDLFRDRLSAEALTAEKLIDSLIWSFVSWLDGGAIRDGSVVYS